MTDARPTKLLNSFFSVAGSVGIVNIEIELF